MAKKRGELKKEYEVLKNERELIQARIENTHNQVRSLTGEKVGYFAFGYERLSCLEIIENNTRNKRDDQKLEVKEYQMLIDNLMSW